MTLIEVDIPNLGIILVPNIEYAQRLYTFPGIFQTNDGMKHLGTYENSVQIGRFGFYGYTDIDTEWYIFVASYYDELKLYFPDQDFDIPFDITNGYLIFLKKRIRLPNIILPILYQILKLESELIKLNYDPNYYLNFHEVLKPGEIGDNVRFHPYERREFKNNSQRIIYDEEVDIYSKLKNLYDKLDAIDSQIN